MVSRLHPTTRREVSDRHHAVFVKDGTNNLIVRLRHNVIRTGLRRINLAYSRISIADIATKLGLERVEDTECIVAKAIRCVHDCQGIDTLHCVSIGVVLVTDWQLITGKGCLLV